MMTDQQPVALSSFHNCFLWVTVEGEEFNPYSRPDRKLFVIFPPSRPYVVIPVVFGSQNRVKPEETTTLAHFNREQPAVDVYLYSAAPALEIWSFQSWGNVTSFDRIDPEPSGRKASPELWLWYSRSHIEFNTATSACSSLESFKLSLVFPLRTQQPTVVLLQTKLHTQDPRVASFGGQVILFFYSLDCLTSLVVIGHLTQ